jgi:hypothetical protein
MCAPITVATGGASGGCQGICQVMPQVVALIAVLGVVLPWNFRGWIRKRLSFRKTSN